MSTRAERVSEAQRLRAEGLLLREIAERMDAKLGTVHAWLADPDLSRHRARRASYAGTCMDCGASTDGSGGPDKAAQRCFECRMRYQREAARWTYAAIVSAIREWATEHDGDPPRAPAWLAKHDARFPYASTVLDVFGTWNAAIEAAGLASRKRGHYGRAGEDWGVVAETVRLYRSGLTLVQVGEVLGVGRNCVRYRLQKAGEPRRPAHRRRSGAMAA